jgi:hypothetical protein
MEAAVKWVVVALAAWAGTAAAQGVVQLDVDAFCRQAATSGGGYAPTINRDCVARQQAAYARVTPQWDATPEAIRTFCAAAAGAPGAGSYSILEACLSRQNAAAANPPTFRR